MKRDPQWYKRWAEQPAGDDNPAPASAPSSAPNDVRRLADDVVRRLAEMGVVDPERVAHRQRAEPRQARVPTGYAAVEVRSESFNEEDRTVEIIWAAGATVKRYSMDEGYYMEELSMDPKHIRLDRFKSGMSLLDTHASDSMANRLGTVVPGSVRIAGGKAYATVRLSRKQAAEDLFQDLKDGHPFPVSVGYRVHKLERREGRAGTLPTLKAIDWEPYELSAVPVPADGGAHSRAEAAACEIITH